MKYLIEPIERISPITSSTSKPKDVEDEKEVVNSTSNNFDDIFLEVLSRT